MTLEVQIVQALVDLAGENADLRREVAELKDRIIPVKEVAEMVDDLAARLFKKECGQMRMASPEERERYRSRCLSHIAASVANLDERIWNEVLLGLRMDPPRSPLDASEASDASRAASADGRAS